MTGGTGPLNNRHSTLSTTAVGRQLVDLVRSCFALVPGILYQGAEVHDTNNSQELDVIFWNDRVAGGFSFLPEILLVECKNWSNKVSSADVAWFDRKIHEGGLSTGFLVAANGITGSLRERTSAHGIIIDALVGGRRLIVITGDELRAISSGEDLLDLCKQRLCELAVRRTFFGVRRRSGTRSSHP